MGKTREISRYFGKSNYLKILRKIICKKKLRTFKYSFVQYLPGTTSGAGRTAYPSGEHLSSPPNQRVYNQINTMGVTSGAGTEHPSGAPEFTPDFQWGSCYSIFSFMCMFCRSLFVHLTFFFWPLCYLFFFDLRILITPLVSSILETIVMFIFCDCMT